MGLVTGGNLVPINRGWWGAADAAMPPGVRKKDMMDTADRPVRKFGGERGGGALVGDIEKPLCRGVTQTDSRWLRKERSHCERWVSLWMPGEHNRPLSYVLSMSAQCSCVAKLCQGVSCVNLFFFFFFKGKNFD